MLLLATARAANADPADDYVACLIGQSAVALQQQTAKKDSEAAQKVAYSLCKEPDGLEENESEGLSDFVYVAVEAIAKGVWPSK
ncbi:hypothetical protein [Sinorhizobium meliloti]|uniref:hypothetical protein n=1 Tax=Rhizobium meliloti TaxID=382 RepID=UPI000FDA8548|nr:hypothetical protein [Sinorhizobium meliloti]RVH92130.1 hypothetical protein CN199_21880 [Sinorhizobium meliloti]RVL16430.1 hypothetical protein CN143_23660 [Sinorhizobium meliloti]RVP31663.1 hypothetical protein CN081_30005 [Sinorhizobium meliloti]